MKKLNKYYATIAKHTYEIIEIEAENDEDAKNISELKCPEGCDVIYVRETPDSFVKRIMENDN